MSNCPVGYTCPLIDEALHLHEQLVSQVENLLTGDFGKLSDVIERLKELVEDDQQFKNVLEEVRSANEQLRDWGYAEEENVKNLEQELSNCEESLDIARAEIRDLEEQIRELENV